MRKFMKFFKSLPAIAFVAAVSIVVAEIAAKQVLSLAPPARAGFYMLDYDDDALRALYGTNDPFERRAMLREQWNEGVPLRYAPYVEFVSGPRRGRSVNVDEQGARLGADLPVDAGSRLTAFYGGSTTFGMGVFDAETIPARFEVAMSERGVPVRAKNFAVNFHQSSQTRVLFQQHLASGFRPDLAVFIEGLNDFVFCGAPDETFLSPALRLADGRAPRWDMFLAQRSNVVQLARRIADAAPRSVGRPCRDDSDVEAVVTRLAENRRITAAVAQAYGVEVLFVLQPVPGFAFDERRRAIRHGAAESEIHKGSARG